MKKRINDFFPVIEKITTNCNLPFSAGSKYDKTFNSFLRRDVEDYFNSGEGITYLIKDQGQIVAYYTISANAIPFQYIIDGESEMWGIPVVEIKMFAVDEKYQDTFYRLENIDMPVAAWCLNYLIYNIQQEIGLKAIYLHSVPEAEQFYRKNRFDDLKEIMKPFHCIDEDIRPLWRKLQPIELGEDDS